MMSQLQPPLIEPLDLAEIKAHLRIEHDDENSLLASYLVAARQMAERILGRALISQHWQYAFARWPDGPLCLPKAPLQSVMAVRIVHEDGTSSLLDPDRYRVESRAEPGFVLLKSGLGLVPLGLSRDRFEIDFIAGYGDQPAMVPAPLRHAILLMVAAFHQSRGTTENVLSGVVRSLLDPYRMVRL
ncbi:phage gp6-like head-tail connector protein [alpha proteobacterium Q-1]|nr:head-tail connector protein [Iodidimonas nitroreducens]GAK34420.1 phage gp6-like head-tail connector protein [alpha proteobacterium Q-1]